MDRKESYRDEQVIGFDFRLDTCERDVLVQIERGRLENVRIYSECNVERGTDKLLREFLSLDGVLERNRDNPFLRKGVLFKLLQHQIVHEIEYRVHSPHCLV